MNQINPQQLLSQIRALNTELQSSAAPPPAPTGVSGFGEMLQNSINEVNASQQNAGELKRAYSAEEPGADLTEVMIAVQKADLSFRAMTEVRNKLVTAYQDIMNMPV